MSRLLVWGLFFVAHQRGKKGKFNRTMWIKVLFQHCSAAKKVHLFTLYISHTFCSSTEVILRSIGYCATKDTTKDLCSLRTVGTIASSL